MEYQTGLSEASLKILGEKSVDKRRIAGKELILLIEKLIAENQYEQINKKIDIFNKMIMQVDIQERDNPQKKRSGLYGLQFIAVTLYNKQLGDYFDLILPQIIKSFGDREFKVQQAACDVMFNIIKSCKESILRYKHFLEIFNNTIELIGTSTNDVKEYAKKVDDQIKDVVYRSLDKRLQFNLDQLIDTICDKMKNSNNNDSQITLIKWIEGLHSITNVNILNCVPRFLFKFLVIVETPLNDKLNQKSELGKKTIELMKSFLHDFKDNHSRSLMLDKEIILELIRYLKDQSRQQESIGTSHFEAFIWLKEFIYFFEIDYNLFNQEQNQIEQSNSNDYLQLQKERKKFMQDIFENQFPDIIEIILIFNKKKNVKDFSQIIYEINKKMQQLVLQIIKDIKDLEKILNMLRKQFGNNNIAMNKEQKELQAQTREIIVNWYILLFKNFDNDLIDLNQDIYQKVIENIDFNHMTLVQVQFDMICMLSHKNEEYFRQIMRLIIQKINMNKKEDQEKINRVIDCLCNSIQPEKIFMEFSTIFNQMSDLIFVQDIIETLTFAIASSPSYKSLRSKLFGSEPTSIAQNQEELFIHLYDSWCINPIASLTLCLLSKKYELAFNLLNHLSDELDQKKLIQLGTLVQLIESPPFIQLRLALMKQNEESKYLIKTLQGVLMILPQSKTFTVLKTRLDCVNITNFSLPFVELKDGNDQKEQIMSSEQNKESIKNCLIQFKKQQQRLSKYVSDSQQITEK